jgi:hypothetical protein
MTIAVRMDLRFEMEDLAFISCLLQIRVRVTATRLALCRHG